jgi:hypothetical protein
VGLLEQVARKVSIHMYLASRHLGQKVHCLSVSSPGAVVAQYCNAHIRVRRVHSIVDVHMCKVNNGKKHEESAMNMPYLTDSGACKLTLESSR